MFGSRIRRWMTATLAAALLASPLAMGDVVKLKNGKSYEGEIIEESGDVLVIRVSRGSMTQDFTLWTNDIAEIVRDDEASGDEVADDAPATSTSPAATTGASGRSTTPSAQNVDLTNKKVFVIPLEGMVGTKFTKAKIEECINAAKKYDPDVIVLQINSGGGMLSELEKIREYLAEVRDEYRIVSWIKQAISAAAMTAMNTREIYFMKEGAMGAATAFNSATMQALQGEELQWWLEYAARMAEEAGYPPQLARVMILKDLELSADIEKLPTGETKVTWYDNAEDGDYVLSRAGDTLTLSASQAERFGISLGTADTAEDLARFLNLDGWVEVSDEGRRIMKAWFDTVDAAEKEIPYLLQRLQQNEGLIGGAPSQRERDRLIGESAQIMKQLIVWCDRCQPVAEYMYGLDKRVLEREMRKLLRQKGG